MGDILGDPNNYIHSRGSRLDTPSLSDLGYVFDHFANFHMNRAGGLLNIVSIELGDSTMSITMLHKDMAEQPC